MSLNSLSQKNRLGLVFAMLPSFLIVYQSWKWFATPLEGLLINAWPFFLSASTIVAAILRWMRPGQSNRVVLIFTVSLLMLYVVHWVAFLVNDPSFGAFLVLDQRTLTLSLLGCLASYAVAVWTLIWNGT